MTFAKVAILMLSAALTGVSLAVPVPEEACLAKLNNNFASILIPSQLTEFVAAIRELNRFQDTGSLVQLLDNPRLEVRARETGLIKSQAHEDKLVQFCEALVKNALSVVYGDDTCNLDTFGPDNEASYGLLLSSARDYPNVDNTLGAMRACMLI